MEKKGKTIALLIPTLTVGGAEKVVIQNAKLFLTMGFKVKIILLTDRVDLKVPFGVEIILSKSLLSAIIILIKMRINNEFDILISFLEKANFINVITSIFNRKVISFLSVHTAPIHGFKIRKPYKRFFISLLYKVSAILKLNIITVSKGVSNELKALYGIDNCTVIPNFIDNDFKSNSLVKKSKNIEVLFLGRLNRIKGLDILYDSLVKLKDEDFDLSEIKINIVGGGDDIYFKTMFSEFINDVVFFQGETHNPENYLEKADYLILPSYAEGFGMVIIEAINNNCDIIYSRCDYGPKEILSDNNSFSFSFCNPSKNKKLAIEQLALIFKKISKNNKNDIVKIKEKKMVLEKYSKENISDMYSDLFINN